MCKFKDLIGFIQGFLNQEASQPASRKETVQMEDFDRQGVRGWGGKLGTKRGLFQARLPPFGGRVGIYPADLITRANQEIPDRLVKGHISGRG